jgi:tetratricopeptide (TPR) repeat protein/TolB-like protein
MFIFLICLAAPAAWPQESGEDKGAGDSPAPIIAVKPFEYASGLPAYKWIGEYLADNLAGRLAGTPGLRIVERAQLEDIYEEMKLSLSGLTEGEAELGGLDAATHLLLGSYRIDGSSIHITAKLVEVATGKVIAGSTITVDREALNAASQEVGKIVLTGLGLGPPAAERSIPELSLGQHRSLRRARELWKELPFHELHPRRRRKKIEFQDAVDELERLLMDTPGHTEAYYLTGEFYLQLGRYEDAASYFDVLASDDGDPARGHLGYGDLYRFRREMERALEHYEKSLHHDPADPGALYGRAKCLLYLDRNEDAARVLLKLLGAAPELEVASSLLDVVIDRIGAGRINRRDDQPLYAALAGILQAEKGNQCGAADLFGNAGEAAGELYMNAFSRAACLFYRHQYAEAQQAAERAKQLHPTYAPVHKLAGEIAMARQSWETAVSSFRTYMNLSTEGADFPEVQRYIDRCLQHL